MAMLSRQCGDKWSVEAFSNTIVSKVLEYLWRLMVVWTILTFEYDLSGLGITSAFHEKPSSFLQVHWSFKYTNVCIAFNKQCTREKVQIKRSQNRLSLASNNWIFIRQNDGTAKKIVRASVVYTLQQNKAVIRILYWRFLTCNRQKRADAVWFLSTKSCKL